MTRAALPLLLVLAAVGCRTTEPLSGDRAGTSGDPVLAAKQPAGPAAATRAVDGPTTTADAVQPADGGPTSEPTEATRAAEPTPEPGTADPTPAPTTPAITAFFASYPEDAVADPRYTARKPPKREGEIRGLLDVRPLLGQPVLASPKPTAAVIATLAPEGLVTSTDSCMWVLFQPEIAWTKGKIRCGDLFVRQPDEGEGMEEMVPVLETVTAGGTRWARIIATNDGRTGWVATESAPRRFAKVLARYSAGGSPTWDRTLYAEPGVGPVKLEFRGAIALRIRESRVVDGRTWLRVEARVDQCIEGSRRKLGEGWLPQHAEDGALNVYYELSC